MRYKACIFDFDYTLGDSTDGIVLSVNTALKSMGCKEKEREQIRRTVGLSLKETYIELTGDKNEDRASEFSKYFREKADEVMVENTVFLPYVKEVLKKLRNDGYQTGIVTTKYHYRIDNILKKEDAVELIGHVIGGEDVKREKPDPEGLLTVIKLMGIRKDEAVYIGDSVVDAKTAKQAGVDFVGVTTGTTSREVLDTYPNLSVLDSLKGFVEMISELPDRNGIKVRQAVKEDLDRIAMIEAQCFPEEEAASRETLYRRFSAFPECFLVAEKNGFIVGDIQGAVIDCQVITDEMYKDESLHNPNGLYQSVFGIDVLEEHRHQGIARALMMELIRISKERGRKGMILTCKDHLIPFYKSFGFHHKGVSNSTHGGAVWNDMLLEFETTN